MNKKIETEYKRILAVIKEKYEPEKIYIFGSFATGNFKKESDLDFFIIKNSNKSRRERKREVSRMLIDRKVPVDILVYTPQEVKEREKLGDFFIKNILKTGKLVYAR